MKKDKGRGRALARTHDLLAYKEIWTRKNDAKTLQGGTGLQDHEHVKLTDGRIGSWSRVARAEIHRLTLLGSTSAARPRNAGGFAAERREVRRGGNVRASRRGDYLGKNISRTFGNNCQPR